MTEVVTDIHSCVPSDTSFGTTYRLLACLCTPCHMYFIGAESERDSQPGETRPISWNKFTFALLCFLSEAFGNPSDS